jgi:opacity protein-like surface antigen
MKHLAVLIVVVLFTSEGPAQPEPGNVEVSLSASFQNFGSENGGGSSSNFLIAPRVGFFPYKGLEIEPEVVLLAGEGDALYMLNGNIAYNFLAAGKTVPFLLLGYGIANTVPIFNLPIADVGYSVGVLNVGAGAKVFFAKNVAVRTEHRYQRFSGEESVLFGSFQRTRKVAVRIHSVQVGLSVLL